MNEILTLILSHSTVIALSAWLGKIWQDRISRKETNHLAKEIENFKSLLSLKNQAISGNREKEIDAYTVIWQEYVKATELIIELCGFLSAHSQTGNQIVDYRKLQMGIYDAIKSIRSAVQSNSPFIDTSVIAAHKNAYDQMFKLVGDIDEMLKQGMAPQVESLPRVFGPMLAPLESAIRSRVVAANL